MIWALSLVFVIIIILWVFLRQNVQFNIDFEYLPTLRKELIEIYWRKRKIYSKTLHESREDLTEKIFWKDMNRWATTIKPLFLDEGKQGLQKDALQEVHIDYVKWRSCIGLKDAAITGMFTGSLWVVKAAVLNMLQNMSKGLKEEQINIQPVFNQYMFSTSIHCQATLKLSKVISTYIKFRNQIH